MWAICRAQADQAWRVWARYDGTFTDGMRSISEISDPEVVIMDTFQDAAWFATEQGWEISSRARKV